MLADLAYNELKELGGKIIALTVHGQAKFVAVNIATRVLVHYQEALVFFVDIAEQIEKLVEVYFHVSIFVVA